MKASDRLVEEILRSHLNNASKESAIAKIKRIEELLTMNKYDGGTYAYDDNPFRGEYGP